jgi:signal transduction histidine kinase
VSHELRTPLARLLALLDSAGLPGADTDALLEQARAEVDQMSELVDDVLFLSELESGRAVVALGGTEVGPVVEETIAALGPSAERAGLELVVSVEPGVSAPLRPRMLRVLIENLVANAIRYAGDGARCIVSARHEGEHVLISVADTGRGVLEAELPRLFERFFRGDLTRTTRGTGLGLAIVKHIVSSAGGQVQASSGLDGSGLEVRCLFPT